MKFENLIHSRALSLLVVVPLAFAGCGDDGASDTNETDTSGDGDGDTGDGDGDTGDGDGDTGDGDGDTGDGDGDGEPGDGDGDAGAGMVRLVHAGVFPGDTGTDVDIFVNGAPAGITFAFKQGTGYVELPAGTYDFDVVPAGGAIEDSVFSVPDFAIADGDMWEIWASGYVAPEGEGDAGFSVFALAENHVDIPAGSNRFNIIHAGALGALNPVDVWAVDADCAPVMPLFPDFAYGTFAADVDLPDAEIKVGFDVGQDATVDACFTIPALGGILVNAFAINDSQGNVSILAHLPDGSVVELTPE